MKFKITDAKGRSVIINRRDSVNEKFPRFKEEEVKEPTACKDEAEKVFTDEEVASLKKLLEKADDLLKLLKSMSDKDEEESEEEESEEEEDVEKSEEESEEFLDQQELAPDDSKDEEVIETSEEEEEEIEDSCGKKAVAHDSKKSYGAIETRDSIDDSIDVDTEIAQSWAKYYGGNN